MAHLSQLLEQPRHQAVITDLVKLTEDTVAAQSGITRMALKGALAAAAKLDGDIVRKAIARILPDVLAELDPYWQQYTSTPQTGNFGDFLNVHAAAVAQSLLDVADRNAQNINNITVAKAYNSLRGKAVKIIEPQVPAVGRVLALHM